MSQSAPSISIYSVTVIAKIRVVPGSVVSVITKGSALPIRYEGLAPRTHPSWDSRRR